MSNFPQKIRQNPVSLQKNGTSEQGVSLYLTIIIMSILLAIVLGMSAILFYQLKMMREMGSSVVAFYAADTGIENALYDENNCLLIIDTFSCATSYSVPCANDTNGDGFCDGVSADYNTGEVSLGGSGATYEAQFIIGPPSGFQSKGSFRKTKRAIEMVY